jgi:hypothetical protein
MEREELNQVLVELSFLREWVSANTRRLDDLESSAFVLEDTEEVILVTVPKKDNLSNI